MNNNSQKNATVAVIYDNKILLLKRGETSPWMPNKYCLPGGGVEKDETLIHAACRELYEETKIIIPPKFMKSVDVHYKDKNKIVFVGNVKNAKVTLNFEHSDYVWASLKDIAKYKIVPGLSSTILTLIHHHYLK